MRAVINNSSVIVFQDSHYGRGLACRHLVRAFLRHRGEDERTRNRIRGPDRAVLNRWPVQSQIWRPRTSHIRRGRIPTPIGSVQGVQ